MFKRAEYMVTKNIEKWPLSTTLPLIDAFPRENAREHFLSLTVWEYLHSFSHSFHIVVNRY